MSRDKLLIWECYLKDHTFASKLMYQFSSICRAFEYELQRLSSTDCYFTSVSNQLRQKRDYLAKVLKNAGLEPIVPDGGYFIMADWSKLGKSISSKPENYKILNTILRWNVNFKRENNEKLQKKIGLISVPRQIRKRICGSRNGWARPRNCKVFHHRFSSAKIINISVNHSFVFASSR